MTRPSTRSPRWPLVALVALAVLTALAAAHRPLTAGSTATFKASTFDELNKGEPQGTFISSEGEVVAGRAAKRITVAGKKSIATLVFSTATGDDGTVYFGTGDEGHILAVRGNNVRKVADLKSVLVTSLTPGPGGRLLAGTMPDARVLSVDPKTGRWKQLAKLEAGHVWALLYDAKGGRVFAATGSPGKVFSIPAAGGKPELYYDPGEKHLLCLARGRGNALLTGSADKAILYEITGPKKGRAVHDFDATELRDVVVGLDGSMYVAVNKFARKTSGLPRFDRSKDGEEGTAVTAKKKKSDDRPKVRPQELRPGAKEGKGAVYRVEHTGNAEELLALDKGYFTALGLDRKGVLWAGDGTKGKVYLVLPDRTVLTAFDFPERQVLALSVHGKEQFLGTGDAGAVYRLAPGPDAKPAYLSEVFDAKYPARWGTMHFLGSGKLRVESRSGNTAKPDGTWSGWRPANIGLGDRAKLGSPPGRYLQLRFTLLQPTGLLRSFTVFHRPTNQRARVTEISFDGQSDKDKEKKKEKTPKIKITWKVENPDGDPLVYRVYARQEMGLTWRKISGHEPLEKAELEWDTEPVADGHYRIKVVASDERANPPATTLTDARISARLLVDNRKPEVIGLVVRYPWVTGLARDSYSPIARIEYSLDGKPWRLVDTTDGIYDSPAEGFRFPLAPKLRTGAHAIAIRAVDAADNMGVVQVSFVR